MKDSYYKKCLVLGIFILFIGVTLPINSLIENVKADSPDIIFYDDFESYTTGSFPTSGGWELVWNGKGNSYQKIIDTESVSGSKSFQLWGVNSWSSIVQKKFTPTANYIVMN